VPASLKQRIESKGQKRILACDGGGLRGLMSVEILARLENDLRRERGEPSLLLCDYFDFVCGTSTGAIIAACIAVGMSMDKIRDFYMRSGEQMFDEASLLKRLHYRFESEPLAEKIKEELNAALGLPKHGPCATLGDVAVRTMLMLVLRNHSTDSPWPVSNNPFANYNQRNRDDCNLDLPLWKLVRASTAAPTYFPPEIVVFREGKPNEYSFVFVDGGVTTYNNPAFLAFQMATAEPYKVGWLTGAEKMLIVSIGTGGAPAARPDLKLREMTAIHYALSLPSALMNAASAGWDMACRTIGECRFGSTIDREFGEMQLLSDAASKPDTSNWTGVKAFAYVRYDPNLTRTGLDALGLQKIGPGDVQKLDSVRHIPEIQRVGEAFAQKYVDTKSHLRGFIAP